MDLGERISPASVSHFRKVVLNVELLRDARTKLAACFNILLVFRRQMVAATQSRRRLESPFLHGRYPDLPILEPSFYGSTRQSLDTQHPAARSNPSRAFHCSTQAIETLDSPLATSSFQTA